MGGGGWWGGLDVRGVLAVAVALALASGGEGSKTPKPLLAGSLTWAINKDFVLGGNNRTVTFTLLTAFELNTSTAHGCRWQDVYCTGGTAGVGTACTTNANKANCTAGGGTCAPVITCTTAINDDRQFGNLCVDQYTTTTPPGVISKLALNPVSNYTAGICPTSILSPATVGTPNRFEVVDVRRINGVKVVFGRRVHTVLVNSTTVALIAYFANNVDSLNPNSQRGVLGPLQGVLMPQCQSGLTPSTPCGVNIRDAVSPPNFGLFKNDFGNPAQGVTSSVGASTYWGKQAEFSASWPNTNQTRGTTSVFMQSPSLETMVQLCSTTTTKWSCTGTTGTETITNYFSPVAVMPPFPQFAVTRVTQDVPSSTTSAAKYWWFKNGATTYKAPHPPIWLKAFDYDGHMMTIYDYNSGQNPKASNLRSDCWSGSANGVFPAGAPGGAEWPFYVNKPFPAGEQKCAYLFGDNTTEANDVSKGNLIKLDFDFGNRGNVSQSYTFSPLYNSVWYRCPGNNQACTFPPPAGGSSNTDQWCKTFNNLPDTDNVCSGSRMFSQHVINTLDLPFVDVDAAASQNFDEQVPTFFSTEGNPRSALSQTLFSAFGCYAGDTNQPPRFVQNLDRLHDECRRVTGSSVNDSLVETEYRCKAGRECIIPLYAIDFNINVTRGLVSRPSQQHPLPRMRPSTSLSRSLSLSPLASSAPSVPCLVLSLPLCVVPPFALPCLLSPHGHPTTLGVVGAPPPTAPQAAFSPSSLPRRPSRHPTTHASTFLPCKPNANLCTQTTQPCPSP